MKTIPRRRPTYIATCLMLALTCLRPAPAELLDQEFKVNTYTTSVQFRPSVATDGSGNFVIVWESLQDGASYDVFGQRFDSDGNPIGGEFLVNSQTANNQTLPAVAVAGAGDFVVVWQSSGQDGSGSGVFGQKFDSIGSPVGPEFQVNSFTTGSQSSPRVASNGSDSFVVVWASLGQDGSAEGVFGQRFDSSGGHVGSEFQINSYTAAAQYSADVSMGSASDFVVVWESLYQDGSSHGVFGQRFNSSGAAEGSGFRVNSYTTNSQRRPDVSKDASGNFVVVWDSTDQDGSYHGVFGQQFTPSGSPLGSEFQVNTYTTETQYGASVAANGSGGFLVTWVSYGGQDGSFAGIFGKHFNSAGVQIGAEYQVNSYSTSSQKRPEAVQDDLGRFVVVWDSNGQDGSNVGVFGRRSLGIFVNGFDLGDACTWSATQGGGC